MYPLSDLDNFKDVEAQFVICFQVLTPPILDNLGNIGKGEKWRAVCLVELKDGVHHDRSVGEFLAEVGQARLRKGWPAPHGFTMGK